MLTQDEAGRMMFEVFMFIVLALRNSHQNLPLHKHQPDLDALSWDNSR